MSTRGRPGSCVLRREDGARGGNEPRPVACDAGTAGGSLHVHVTLAPGRAVEDGQKYVVDRVAFGDVAVLNSEVVRIPVSHSSFSRLRAVNRSDALSLLQPWSIGLGSWSYN